MWSACDDVPMSDRGPSGPDPDPTEYFPRLPDPDPAAPTGPTPLPPLGSERDPDPTRVMPPAEPPTVSEYPPTTAMPPTGGGPYEPGPPYGGGGGGPGGGGPYGDDPELNPEPDPWYRQPGPLAALIAGLAAVVVGLIALFMWTSDDGDTDDTLPSVSTSSTSVPDTTTTSTPATTTEATTTSTGSTSTTTSSTTTTTTTTTTLPPTTTTEATTTTQAPTTTTAATTTTTIVPPPVPGASLWDIISATPALSQFRAAIVASGLEDLFESTSDEYTVLAPVNDAFTGQSGDFDVNDYLIPGRITAAEIFANDSVDVESGATLAVDDTRQTVGGAVMTSSRDVDASNGYIDVIASFVTPE